MFGDFNLADEIAINCAVIDNLCRQELREGIIVNEREYVSNLSTRIRDAFRGIYPCHAQTLRQGIEMENGVDGVIIFKCGEEVKVGWYEAKWPRVQQANYPWDSVHAVRDLSHFSEQLIKQTSWNDSLALWEMFFNEAEDGFETPPYETHGSSCVWHENAYDFIISEGIVHERWTTAKLKTLLEKHGTNFYNIIFSIISCRRGKRIVIIPGQRYLSLGNIRGDIINVEDNTDDIPLPSDVNSDVDDAITSFMQKRNLAGYVYIDINPQQIISE